MVFLKCFIIFLNNVWTVRGRIINPCSIFYFREIFLKSRQQCRGRYRSFGNLTTKTVFKRSPVNSIRFFMKGIVTDFMLNPNHQQNESRQPKPQSKNVNKRVRGVFTKITEANEQVVFKHGIEVFG